MILKKMDEIWHSLWAISTVWTLFRENSILMPIKTQQTMVIVFVFVLRKSVLFSYNLQERLSM